MCLDTWKPCSPEVGKREWDVVEAETSLCLTILRLQHCFAVLFACFCFCGGLEDIPLLKKGILCCRGPHGHELDPCFESHGKGLERRSLKFTYNIRGHILKKLVPLSVWLSVCFTFFPLCSFFFLSVRIAPGPLEAL